MDALTPQQRRELRAKAHHLHPVVSIGQHGLTPQVLNEIDIALTAHALIKIRVHSDDRDAREAMLRDIAAQLHAAPVQHLGKLLIVWRERDEEEAEAPKPARRPAAKAKKSGTDRRTGPQARRPAVSPREKRGDQPPAGERRRRRTQPDAHPTAVGPAARAADRPRVRGARTKLRTAPKGTFIASGAEGGPRTRGGEGTVKKAPKGPRAGKAPRGAVSTSPRSGKPAAPRRRRAG